MKKNIWVAAGDGDLARVAELIEKDGMGANSADEFTYTPMHAAASYGHIDVLEYLISKGGDVNVTDDEGDTPLYTVENIETARFLTEHGAAVERTNHAGISPIDHLRDDYPDIADYLARVLGTETPAARDDARGTVISQHSQNTASETLTAELMARMSTLEGGDEEGLVEIVSASVLKSLEQGQALQASSSLSAEGDKKRRKIN